MLLKVPKDPVLAKYPEIQLMLGKVPKDPVLGKCPEIQLVMEKIELGKYPEIQEMKCWQSSQRSKRLDVGYFLQALPCFTCARLLRDVASTFFTSLAEFFYC